MKILFVCSGTRSNDQPGTVVRNQANSLINEDLNIEYFLITKKGVKGYLKAIKPLRKKLKNNNYQAIHSHYSLSAFVTTFALLGISPKRHIVSLMGSDAQLKGWKRILTRIFNRRHWTHTIVKSEKMAEVLRLKKFTIVPNGVDLNLVKPKNIPNNKTKTILFAADPKREAKNFELAEKAMQLLDEKKYKLHVVFDLPHQEVIHEINNSDVVLLTSKWEGSPNIIKEAMACNKAIVATKVGDVPWLIEGLEGCYLTDHDENQIAHNIIRACEITKTEGRTRIENLGLSATQIAKKIIKLYSN